MSDDEDTLSFGPTISELVAEVENRMAEHYGAKMGNVQFFKNREK